MEQRAQLAGEAGAPLALPPADEARLSADVPGGAETAWHASARVGSFSGLLGPRLLGSSPLRTGVDGTEVPSTEMLESGEGGKDGVSGLTAPM